jgi:agmatinase
MDKDKLEALRARFGASKGGEIFDARFKKVANTVFQASAFEPSPTVPQLPSTYRNRQVLRP